MLYNLDIMTRIPKILDALSRFQAAKLKNAAVYGEVFSTIQRFQRSLTAGSGSTTINSSASVRTTSTSSRLSPKETIFANNYLNFEDINVIGFDLDYTLVTYTNSLQELIYNMARDSLVTSAGFPESLRNCKYDPTFPVRGLSVDMENGTLCKLSNLQKVGFGLVFRGKRALSATEIESIYGESRHVSRQDIKGNMLPNNDLFNFAEVCLIADAIDQFEARRMRNLEQYSPSAVIEDIKAAIKNVHVSGEMHEAVMKDMPKYIRPSPMVLPMLRHLRASGKSVFLCTNSPFKYADTTLSYILPELNGHWKELFDVIICSASKPLFYSANRPFRVWNVERKAPSVTVVPTLEPGKVYIHGSAKSLQSLMKWNNKEILYVGDNLWADLAEAKRGHGWQTACIIHELDDELDVLNNQTVLQLSNLRSSLRNFLTDLQLDLQRSLLTCSLTGARVTREDTEFIEFLVKELEAINVEISTSFHPLFGSIFRTHGQSTYFSFAIRRYVDLYMCQVGAFENYSPAHRFYPTQSVHSAHEPRRSTADFY